MTQKQQGKAVLRVKMSEKYQKKVSKEVDKSVNFFDIIISIPARPLREHAQKWRVFILMGAVL